MAVLRQIWLHEIIRDTLPRCQNTTIRCHNFPAGSRQAARGARICETSLIHVLMQDLKEKATRGALPYVRLGGFITFSKPLITCGLLVTFGLGHIDIFQRCDDNITLVSVAERRLGVSLRLRENIYQHFFTTNIHQDRAHVKDLLKAANRYVERDVFMGQNMAWLKSCRSNINYVNRHWSRFSNEISSVNQILKQFHFALIQILMTFAHSTTAALSWQAQKFVAIW